MSTASKVLLILSVLLMPVMLYFTVRTLKTYESWGSKAQQMAKTTEQTEAGNKVLIGGEPGEGGAPGIRQLRSEIQRVVADRGRVWIGVMRFGRPGPDGQVRVETDRQLLQARPGTVPFQQAVTPDTLVYAFDDTPPRPGQPAGPYLGQFKVTARDDKSATLMPTERLSPDEAKRLASPGPWSLYEQMPVDNQQTFAGLDPQALATLVPRENLAEYQRSGTKAQANDAPAEVWTRVEFTKPHELDTDAGKVSYEAGEALVVDRGSAEQLIQQGVAKEAPDAEGVSNYYQRPLRDYAYLFREFYRQRTALQADLARDKADLASIGGALADAQKEGQFLQATIADLQSDLKQLQRDAAAARAYAEKLEGRLAALSAEVAQVSQANRELAARLAAGQLQAAERIDERVSAAR
jgi:hypothetical protein